MLLSSDTAVGVTKSMGLGMIGFADALAELKTALQEKEVEKVRDATAKVAITSQTITQGIYSQSGSEGDGGEPTNEEVSDVDFEEVEPK
jgi:GDP/UDP-N,N'-diacetylbacillosamine 2-epimerase (hydrolysing)